VSLLPHRPGSTSRRKVVEVVGDEVRRRPDTVVTEEPMEIRLSWPGHPATRAAVVMRTPGADFELASGFLLSDGVIDASHRPHQVAYCVDRTLSEEQRYNVVTVELESPPRRHPSSRTTSVSSACGVCGTESLDEVFTPGDIIVPIDRTVSPDVIRSLPDALLEKQPLFGKTGSIHASGVFTYAGELLVTREDVGRHNTVDKVLGARLLGSVDFGSNSILCVSGRMGFDIVTKAVAGQISMVVAVGGPSSLALDLADRAGITLCGFTRGSRFVVYTHPDRVSGM
jgi:FdhD protein